VEEATMLLIEATVQATGLGFPEGPLLLPDGRLAFVEEYNGCVSVIEDGRVRVMAHVGGNPNGLALGADGRIYVTRGRGVVGSWHLDPPDAPAIVAVDPANGAWEVVTTTASGRPLRAPNDLCFGPDGMLYFTDPDDFDPDGGLRGWICRTGPAGTELLYELGNTFPNGLAFSPAGRFVWMESHTKRVVGVTSDGKPETLAQLAPETTPDGCAYAADGRLVVATLFTGGLDVIEWTSEGTTIERISWTEGAVNTNCCFEGSSIWVTDVGAGWENAKDTGRLWRLETTLTGLPL
jgi:gluconolactonase